MDQETKLGNSMVDILIEDIESILLNEVKIKQARNRVESIIDSKRSNHLIFRNFRKYPLESRGNALTMDDFWEKLKKLRQISTVQKCNAKKKKNRS